MISYEIQEDTNGIYHCIVNDFYISKAMLNVYGAPFSSALEQYKPNIIAGFSTFGGIILIFALSCGVYNLRYKEEPKKSIFKFYFYFILTLII